MRPGAVPSKNFHSVTSSQSVDKNALNRCEINVKKILTFENEQALKDETFSKKEEHINANIENKNINICYHTSKSQDCVCNYKENDEFCNIQLLKDTNKQDVDTHDSKLENSKFERKILVKTFEENNDNNPNLDFNVGVIKSVNIIEEKNQIYNKSFRAKIFETIEHNIKKHGSTEKNKIMEKTWKQGIASIDSLKKI